MTYVQSDHYNKMYYTQAPLYNYVCTYIHVDTVHTYIRIYMYVHVHTCNTHSLHSHLQVSKRVFLSLMRFTTSSCVAAAKVSPFTRTISSPGCISQEECVIRTYIHDHTFSTIFSLQAVYTTALFWLHYHA